MEERHEIVNGRTWAYINWGYLNQAADDWQELIRLARELENQTILAEAIIFPGFAISRWPLLGELVEEALLIAGKLNDRRLLAGAKMLKAKSVGFQEWHDANEALQIARDLGDSD